MNSIPMPGKAENPPAGAFSGVAAEVLRACVTEYKLAKKDGRGKHKPPTRFIVYKEGEEAWGWLLVTSNGHLKAKSHTTYVTPANTRRAISDLCVELCKEQFTVETRDRKPRYGF